MAYWIWYPGDFEIHHALMLNCRREEHGYHRPAFWRLDDCWHNVRFRRKIVIDKAETIEVKSNGIGNMEVDGNLYAYETPVKLEPGEHTVTIISAKTDGLPCIYVTGDKFTSGAGWEADHFTSKWLPAGFSCMYRNADDNPEKFKFSYEEIEPESSQPKNGGTLYDFGKETFAELCFDAITDGEAFQVNYGESVSEAMDSKECYLRDFVPEDCNTHTMQARAFRYIFIPETQRRFRLSARYEYLPLERRGRFRCSDEKLNQIWETAAYTFHLNSREFFLDGIKRDRWIWSGDAYQSYLINYYLFFDSDIVKRTTLALRGKEPVEQHINTILDYSFYWIIGLGDYYRHTGDLEFIRFIWPRIESLLEFCLSRRNKDDFVAGLENDWVFVDWHRPMDKTGAVCAEQMLFFRALEVAADCAVLLQKTDCEFRKLSEKLRENINRFYWSEQKGAYIDSYESGNDNVTRHANLFAIILNIADDRQIERIISCVINNKAIPQITTPYFKFYELETLCLTGQTAEAYATMREYWGSMLDLGATTIWEEFDPSMEGDRHYAMYGRKFHKSLCHAWGASPIYLLGRYFLGVRPISDAYETFVCEPDLGGLEWMEGIVPVRDGSVQVSLQNGKLRILSDRSGGTLLWDGKEYTIIPGQPIELNM